jgi:hypothetical protein
MVRLDSLTVGLMSLHGRPANARFGRALRHASFLSHSLFLAPTLLPEAFCLVISLVLGLLAMGRTIDMG